MYIDQRISGPPREKTQHVYLVLVPDAQIKEPRSLDEDDVTDALDHDHHPQRSSLNQAADDHEDRKLEDELKPCSYNRNNHFIQGSQAPVLLGGGRVLKLFQEV